jgi:hypothetical protein
MSERQGATLYYSLLIMGGALALILTGYGCLASMMFDYRSPKDISLGLCLILPFPCFLLSLRSLRWSAALLWILFAALWAVRAFTITPNPQFNPVDYPLGISYLALAGIVQIAIFLSPGRSKSPEAVIPPQL